MKIENDLVVAFDYKLTEAGQEEIIDTSAGREPLEFIVGKGHIIPGLEEQLKGMGKGDKGDIKVDATDAYGEFKEEAMQVMPKEQFSGVDLEIGMPLYGQGENGETVQVTVKAIEGDNITVDFNHPLAGKNLMFSVDIVDIRKATDEELANGQVEKPEGDCGCGDGSGGCHS